MIEGEKKGIEGLEKCMDIAAKNIALGIKIGKDGINSEDLVHVPELFKNIQELVEFIAAKPELAAEIKDIDAEEGFALLMKAYKSWQSVKA